MALLVARADVNARDEDDRTPLEFLAHHQFRTYELRQRAWNGQRWHDLEHGKIHLDMARILLEASAGVSLKTQHRTSVLAKARSQFGKSILHDNSHPWNEPEFHYIKELYELIIATRAAAVAVSRLLCLKLSGLGLPVRECEIWVLV